MTRLVSACYEEFFPFQHGIAHEKKHATTKAQDITKGDILIVWGGADISPSLYNRDVSKHCGATDKPSKRDAIEWALMQEAVSKDVPIIGVCRGAQMLCALAGGYLIQDVTDHGGQHLVSPPDDRPFQPLWTNSVHHQMMRPEGTDHELLLVAAPRLSRHYYDVNVQVEVPNEPEYVYFKGVKGFAIQWHPEAMRETSFATRYLFQTINERL